MSTHHNRTAQVTAYSTPTWKPEAGACFEATLIALVGPTGAGKNALAGLLESAGLRRIVTTTTRAPRRDEVEGRDLFVVSPEKFIELRTSNALVAPCEYSSASYGVQLQHLQEAAVSPSAHLIIVEPSGLAALKSWAAAAGVQFRAVFVTAPLETLRKRLERRYVGDSIRQECEDRMACVRDECDRWPHAYRWDLVLDSGNPLRNAQLVLDLVGASTEPVLASPACA